MQKEIAYKETCLLYTFWEMCVYCLQSFAARHVNILFFTKIRKHRISSVAK